MFPIFSFQNIRNSSSRNSVKFYKMSNFPSRIWSIFNYFNLIWCQFATTWVPIFYTFVSHIIRMSSKKKMCRIYTRRIITTMKNVQSYGNFNIKKYENQSVAQNKFSFMPSMSITLFQSISLPKPTVLPFINFYFRPKTN